MRMNWGCGPVTVDGWVNVDIVEHNADVIVADVRDGLPWKDESFDAIIANHSLQCLTANELPVAFDEFRRLLKPHGLLRILVPDIEAALHAFLAGRADWPGFAAIAEDLPLDEKFCRYLTWGGTNRSCFTMTTLCRQLRRHDFQLPPLVSVTPSWLADLDSRLGESLIVTVSK